MPNDFSNNVNAWCCALYGDGLNSTGKTKTIIDTAEVMASLDLVRKVVVIAPLNIVNVWSDEEAGELAKHSSHSRWCAAVGDRKHRVRAIEEAQSWCQHGQRLVWLLINVDGLTVVERELAKFKPDLVIVDESTIIKTRTAKRTKLAIRLFADAPYKTIMSGNPIPKGPDEIFSQYHFIDEGLFGGRYYPFQEKYFDVDYFGKVFDIKDKQLFHSSIHSLAFRKTKTECLDLPPKMFERIYIEMTDEQKKAYKDMEKDALASYHDLECAAPMVITKFLRLSQIAGGFFPGISINGDGAGELASRPILPNKKLEALIDFINDLPSSEQVVIWARFRKEIETISEALTIAGHSNVKFYGGVSPIDRIQARSDFRTGQVRCFIGNPASGGKGLNDLIAGTYVCYFSNDYSAENRQQSEDRNHRKGTEKVTYIDFIMKDTIDETVLNVLRSNKDFSDTLLSRKLCL